MSEEDFFENLSPEKQAAAIELVEAYERRHEVIELLEYDGAKGLPPDWIPEATTWRFRQTRNYFLEDCGYTPETLRRFIDDYGITGTPQFHTHANGKPVDRAAFNLLLGFLANLRWVISLDKDKGLTELASIDVANAAYGERMRKGPKGPRVDALKSCMIDAFNALKRGRKDTPTSEEVLNYLKGGQFTNTIQEIDRETEVIYWVNRRRVDKTTSFSSFNNRMVAIRKEYLA